MQMKKTAISILCLGMILTVLAGCSVNVNVNKEKPDVGAMIAENALKADPLEFNIDGVYSAVFRYGKGGFENMDLSEAYIAYYPTGLTDTINSITEGSSGDDEIPDLPEDVQDIIADMEGTDKLEKVAITTVETQDDTTLKVCFKDPDQLAKDHTYFFVIPNENLAGAVIAERND